MESGIRGLGVESGIKNQESRDEVPEPVDNGMRLTGKRKVALGILVGLFVCQVGGYWFPISAFIDLTPYGYVGTMSQAVYPPEWIRVMLDARDLHHTYGWLMALGYIILGVLVLTGRLDRLNVRIGKAGSKLHLESGIGNL